MLRPILLAGLFTTAILATGAQQPAKAPDANTDATALAQARLALGIAKAQVISINGQNCPVSAYAERGAPGAVVQTRNGDELAQTKLYLHFESTAKGIREVAITLHGSDAHGRLELAQPGSNGNLTEDFHLTSGSISGLRNTAVSPAKVVNVRWIGITEIEFADGSTWHRSSQSYCHIQPNGFRLIDATAY